MARIWKWVRACVAAVLWSGVLAGLAGFAEGVSQWSRFGGWTAGGGESGFVRSVAPSVTLYSWFAMAVAALLFAPYAVAVRRRPSARLRAYALTTATAVASLAFFYAGYAGREHLWPVWWAEHELRAAFALQAGLFLALAVLLVRPLTVLAGSLVLTPRRNLFLTVIFLLVFTSLWPDWRDEGRQERCGALARVAAAPSGPNVVLVTIDAWRRDHLGALAGREGLTPEIDRLAGEGLLYTGAWSSSCWTLPGMGTLMTGRSPRELGVERHRPLPPGAPTLAQVAWSAGWHTAAFATNPYLTSAYGFDRGFAEFEHSLVLEPLQPAARSVLARELTHWVDRFADLDAAEYVVGKAVRWLPARPKDRPFLLWLHLLDPHLPYTARRLPGDGPAPATPRHALLDDHGLAAERLGDVRDGLGGMTPAVREAIAALYAGEVRYADHHLARLFAALRDAGLWDSTLIVVTADHGEELFDHGGFEHGHSLLPEVSGVPLVVKLPAGGAADRRIDGDRASADLLPTLCAALGWTPPDGLRGRSDLWPVGDAAPPTVWTGAAAPAVLENVLYGAPQSAVRAWPYFAVLKQDAAPAWYDLAADPAALRPLGAAPPAATLVLAAADSVRTDGDRAAPVLAGPQPLLVAPDRALQRQLRSLGY
jgi:arylsulfatase A-like enzyme